MGITDKLGFSDKEKLLIKRVLTISITGCIIAVAGTWVVRYGLIRYTEMHKPAQHEQLEPDLTDFYISKSDQVLPVDIEAHTFAVRYYMQNDQAGKAIEHILRILPLSPKDRHLRLTLATAYLQSGSYRHALDELEKLKSEEVADSLSASIAAQYGLTLYYLNRLEEGRMWLTTCMNTRPQSAEAACYLGQVEAAIHTPSILADSLLKLATTIDPSYAEAWYQLGRYYMNTGDYTACRNYLLTSLKFEPLNIKAHARLGMVYYYLNQPELAKKSYETALALNPDDFNTHYNFGELLYSVIGDKHMALIEFKKALDLKPDHADANFKTGLICLDIGMSKEAVRFLEQANTFGPNSTRILLQLAAAYERLSIHDKAMEVYKRILELDQLNVIALQKVEMLSRVQ